MFISTDDFKRIQFGYWSHGKQSVTGSHLGSANTTVSSSNDIDNHGKFPATSRTLVVNLHGVSDVDRLRVGV